MEQPFNNINKVAGSLSLPGDKSISHRSVIFSSMAEGESIIHNLGNGEDVNQPLAASLQWVLHLKVIMIP